MTRKRSGRGRVGAVVPAGMVRHRGRLVPLARLRPAPTVAPDPEPGPTSVVDPRVPLLPDVDELVAVPGEVLADPWSADAADALRRVGWSGSVCAQSDPEVWFPEVGCSPAAAVLLCAGCPLRACCLALALVGGEEYGVWGGLTSLRRRRLVRALDSGQPLVDVLADGLAVAARQAEKSRAVAA